MPIFKRPFIRAIANARNSGDGRRRTPVIARLMLGLLMLPILLAPSHPVAVYGYLAATYFPAMSRPVYADAGGGLEDFLVTPDQVERYRSELLLDMADSRSGKLFAIVQRGDGQLEHAPIRTWNSFLPESTPENLSGWLDRKEFPFLADEVTLWLDGKTIVAMGHYHVFGGGPSEGDQLAQQISEVPEVVISNGVVPFIYLRGALLAYGEVEQVDESVYRSLRTLERSLTMGLEEVTPFPDKPSPALQSFLAHLRDSGGINIEDRQDVACGILRLCRRFESDNRPYFGEKFFMGAMGEHLDKSQLLRNFDMLKAWAGLYEILPSSGT